MNYEKTKSPEGGKKNQERTTYTTTCFEWASCTKEENQF